jgi:hypothetical protein
MASQHDRKKKIVAGLAALLADEERELSKFRRLGTRCQWAGAIFIAAALFASFQQSWVVIMFIAIGVIGGFLGGLSLLYASFLEQWPVIKPFLNREAVEEASRLNDATPVPPGNP